MFDIGFTELLLVGIVALIVLGPERLPRAARMAGLWMRKARASWYAMRSEFERELADEDLRRSLKQGGEEAKALKQDIEQSTRAIGGEISDELTVVPRAAEEAARSVRDAGAETSRSEDAASELVVPSGSDAPRTGGAS